MQPAKTLSEVQTSAESTLAAEPSSGPLFPDDSLLQLDTAGVSEEVDGHELAGQVVGEYIRDLDEYDAQSKAVGYRWEVAASGNGGKSYEALCSEFEQATTKWRENQGDKVDRAHQSRKALGELDHVADHIEEACEDLTALASSLSAAARRRMKHSKL